MLDKRLPALQPLPKNQRELNVSIQALNVTSKAYLAHQLRVLRQSTSKLESAHPLRIHPATQLMHFSNGRFFLDRKYDQR